MAKVVIMGPKQSGKSALAKRLAGEDFIENHIPTMGADYYQRTIESVISNEFDVELWDLQDDKSLIQTMLRDVDIVICTFSLSDRDSIKELQRNYLADLDLNPTYTLSKPVYLLVGTHGDQPTDIPKQEISSLSAQYHMPFFEVSARTTQGIAELFQCLKERLLELFNKRSFVRSNLKEQDLTSKKTKIKKRLEAATQECGYLWHKGRSPLENIRNILDDYAMQNNGWQLWFSRHANRHHTFQVAQIVSHIDQSKFSSIKEILEALDSIPYKSLQGSLSLRISFIKSQLGENDPEQAEFIEPKSTWLCGIC